MSYLFDIQRDVQQIAEVISEALGVETEIIDENMAVIGSTSYNAQDYAAVWGGTTPWNSSNAQISKHIFETRRPLILEDPGENPLCRNCTERNQCYYKAGLYYPILHEGRCCGIISLVAFNQQQKDHILNNAFSYMKFTRKIADILASKIGESVSREQMYRNNRYLQTIISAVHEGIIACDEKGRITCFNHSAEEKLSLNAEKVLGHPADEVIPGSLLTEALAKGVSLYDTGVTYRNNHLISNVTLIREHGQITGAVESFNTDERLYRLAHKLLKPDDSTSFSHIIGRSPAISDVKDRSAAIAKSPSTVLITGESGTGKELFARAIHHGSLRAEQPFIAINCSAIPEALLESELFGYEGGAFTGARSSGKPGLFEMAQGGTVFLDEIGDMPLMLQSKLLRVLQDRQIQRVGGTKTTPVDVRVIAATHRNLEAMVAAGEFRQDLYYRLNVIPIAIPPLRERREDIPELIGFLCQKYGAILGKTTERISDEALALLLSHPWPGNIRQLENAIEYAVNYTADGGVITLSHLPQWLTEDTPEQETDTASFYIKDEKHLIEATLSRTGKDVPGKKKAAQELGISLATLYRKLRKYQIRL